MEGKLNRRDFVVAGTAAGLSLAIAGKAESQALQAPNIITRKAAEPVVIASSNGHRFKNGGTVTAVEKAFTMMVGGADVLDSLIAGVNIVELDPLDGSVGYGGLPNAEGVVQLDSCVMHGPKRRAGGVASIEGVRTPSLVAKAVMEMTDHHLLVGKGAQDFARNMGFTIEDDLNTPNSRKLWLEWKRRIDPEHYLDPTKRSDAAHAAGMSMVADGFIDPEHYYGTINCDGVNSKGEVCGVTTTSGLAWKIPGRVGDSPVLGAGLYVDGDVGAAGSTGRGEANLYNLSSYLIVENMRRGMHPKDAAMDACKRIQKNTVEKRLLNSRGMPNFGISFYCLNAKGQHAGVTMYGGRSYAVCTASGGRIVPTEALLSGEAGG